MSNLYFPLFDKSTGQTSNMSVVDISDIPASYGDKTLAEFFKTERQNNISTKDIKAQNMTKYVKHITLLDPQKFNANQYTNPVGNTLVKVQNSGGSIRYVMRNAGGGVINSALEKMYIIANPTSEDPSFSFIEYSNKFGFAYIIVDGKIQWLTFNITWDIIDGTETLRFNCFVSNDKSIAKYISEWFGTTKPVLPEPWGPESKPGGGGGTFDPGSDIIPAPVVPTVTATASGFVNVYCPSLAQIQDLAQYLWAGPWNFDAFRRLFADPMDCILSLNILPINLPGATMSKVSVGNISTGIEMPLVTSQFQTIQCGEIEIKEFFGSALDYAPYTRAYIYLPYVGYKDLDINDIMGRKVNVSYTIDILTGACLALIKCNDTIMYQFTGECASPIPISSQDSSSTYGAILGIVAGAVAIGATAGTAAPAVAGAGAAGATASTAATTAASTAAVVGGAATAANSAMNLKPRVQRSGAIAGTSGMMSVQKPYIIIERPIQSLAHDYNKYAGFPSNITYKLSDLQGFTQIESIVLNGFGGYTSEEIAELNQILKGGVIL